MCGALDVGDFFPRVTGGHCHIKEGAYAWPTTQIPDPLWEENQLNLYPLHYFLLKMHTHLGSNLKALFHWGRIFLKKHTPFREDLTIKHIPLREHF